MSDRLANFFFVSACVVLVGVILYPRLYPRRDTPTPAKATGQVLEPLTEERVAPVERSIYVFYSESCGYCAKSLPLYRELLKACDPSVCRLQFLTTGPAASLRGYLAGIGFDVPEDGVISVKPGVWALQVTPTLYVTNKERRLIYAKVGMLDEADRNQLLMHVTTPKSGN